MYIFLLLYIAIHIFELWLEYLNYKNLRINASNVPAEFAEHISVDTLEKTNRYTIDNMRFGIITSLVGSAETLIFIFGGLLAWYNGWVNSLELSHITSGIVFFLILTYVKGALGTPFSLYSTFKIEKKYGFNTMTLKLWITDGIKGIAISAILMSLLISVALWICYSFQQWWLPVWGFFLVFSLFMMYISPYVLEPLFNKFVPIEDEELEDEIKETVARAGITVSGVYKMDASKRTKHSNAYFSGIGAVKRIVLFDTLLEQLTKEELLAVLAHEAGHCKKKHIIKNLILIETFLLIGAYGAFTLMEGEWLPELFAVENASFFTKFILLNFVASVVLYPLGSLMHIISRIFEREADDFAIDLIGSGEPLADALVKLSKDNLSNMHPHPLYAKVHYSHPPAVERIRRLRGK